MPDFWIRGCVQLPILGLGAFALFVIGDALCRRWFGRTVWDALMAGK